MGVFFLWPGIEPERAFRVKNTHRRGVFSEKVRAGTETRGVWVATQDFARLFRSKTRFPPPPPQKKPSTDRDILSIDGFFFAPNPSNTAVSTIFQPHIFLY